jgi:hypothetical protein
MLEILFLPISQPCTLFADYMVENFVFSDKTRTVMLTEVELNTTTGFIALVVGRKI